MHQLTNEEKEALLLFSKKYNVKLRIYFLEKQSQAFIKKVNEEYEKMNFDNIVSFQTILEKVEVNILLDFQ